MDPYLSKKGVGRHAFSEDGLTWRYLGGGEDITTAFSATVQLVGGGAIKLQRRERPELLFDESGEIVGLVSGVVPGWSGDQSFTLAQRVGPSPSPSPTPAPTPSPSPSPIPVPTPPSSTCNFVQGIGLDGYSDRVDVASQELCCELCSGRTACTQAVYQNGKCKFGTSTAAQVEVADAVLCSLAPTPTPRPSPSPPSPVPRPSSCNFIEGTGLDNYGDRMAVDSQQECCDMCAVELGCKQVVFQHGKCKFAGASAAQVAVSDAVLCKVQSRDMQMSIV